MTPKSQMKNFSGVISRIYFEIFFGSADRLRSEGFILPEDS